MGVLHPVSDHLKPKGWKPPPPGFCPLSDTYPRDDAPTGERVAICPHCGARITWQHAANEAPRWPAHILGDDAVARWDDKLLAHIGVERVRAWLDRMDRST